MNLWSYFSEGTSGTKTGERIGMEIETDFVKSDGQPIDSGTTKAILGANFDRPAACIHKLELGRQKIELAIAPQTSIGRLMVEARTGLSWLYSVAARHEAYPLIGPEIVSDQELLLVTEERDSLWVTMDGKNALEQLCRCSSVQFTVDVNPADAIGWVNLLWNKQLHDQDYASNDRRWKSYIALSRAEYKADRYAGPPGFSDMAGYVAELSRHAVVMHQGIPCRMSIEELPEVDIDLFLRSVWWHYRLRRYGDVLALEIRPLARREDHAFIWQWEQIRQILGL